MRKRRRTWQLMTEPARLPCLICRIRNGSDHLHTIRDSRGSPCVHYRLCSVCEALDGCHDLAKAILRPTIEAAEANRAAEANYRP
jgi:hypothetical protein